MPYMTQTYENTAMLLISHLECDVCEVHLVLATEVCNSYVGAAQQRR
jgi:hypothetical protein